jgi:hypothetical protein
MRGRISWENKAKEYKWGRKGLYTKRECDLWRDTNSHEGMAKRTQWCKMVWSTQKDRDQWEIKKRMGPSTDPPIAERVLIDHPRDRRGKTCTTSSSTNYSITPHLLCLSTTPEVTGFPAPSRTGLFLVCLHVLIPMLGVPHVTRLSPIQLLIPLVLMWTTTQPMLGTSTQGRTYTSLTLCIRLVCRWLIVCPNM